MLWGASRARPLALARLLRRPAPRARAPAPPPPRRLQPLHNLFIFRPLTTIPRPQRSHLSQEDLLEKMVANLSSDIHQKNRVYKNDLMRVLGNIKENNFSTSKQGLLLLRCCTELLPEESPTDRMLLVEQVWNTLKPHTTFTTDHYNELLRCYIANNRTITVSSFVAQMTPVIPNVTTYELMLRAICEVRIVYVGTGTAAQVLREEIHTPLKTLFEKAKQTKNKAGDLNQAAELISNMKALGISATERMFNSLIIGHGRAGNPDKIEEVLLMMKTVKVDTTTDTYTAIARAYAMNGDTRAVLNLLEVARGLGFHFQEEHIMEIVKAVALKGHTSYTALPKILRFLPENILDSPSISAYMQSVTTQLVYLNCPMAALEVYKCLPLPSFGPKDDTGLHGRSLVRDCVKASMPSSVIGLITEELMNTGRNPIALQNATEAALQLGKTPLALDLLTRMKQVKLPVRPHYFWPILIINSKNYGEKGIMNILSTMIVMDVQPDYDTLLDYVMPYVSFSSPQNLMKKFIDCGLTVSMVLTPMMHILVSSGQVRAASELCELFEGTIDSEKLLSPLLKGYLTSQDVFSTIYVLEELKNKASQGNSDWVGRFLCKMITHKKIREDKTHFIELVKALKKTKLRISTAATDHCLSQMTTHKSNERTIEELKNDLVAITDEHIVDESDMFMTHVLPHPRSMDEATLRAHLAELDAKGMNTRGVLRKLLQTYCREGNLKAAREIADKCQKEGVFLSAGMKAAIFDLHVKLGELELAEQSLAELNKSSPNFTLDEFKVIDFATLMAYRKKFSKAYDLIVQQSNKRRVIGGRSIEHNCWRLLDAIAANGTPKQTQNMFALLLQYGYCKPTNVILGPLIRVHMKDEDISYAVNEFIRISNKYNRTPLKHELLCRVLQAMSDGKSEDSFVFNEQTDGRLNKFVKAILNADRKVHGPGSVQLTLTAALAEVGYKKSLRKFLLDPSIKIHPEALLRRCEKFADEKKLEPIETIAECAKDLRHIDTDVLYEIMLQVHQRNDDCQSALSLWYKMQEDDVRPSQKFINNFASMLKANNKAVPPEVLGLLDSHTRNKMMSK